MWKNPYDHNHLTWKSEGEWRNNEEGKGGRVDKRNGRSSEDDFLSTNEKLFLRATDNEGSFNAEGDEGKKYGGLATEEFFS